MQQTCCTAGAGVLARTGTAFLGILVLPMPNTRTGLGSTMGRVQSCSRPSSRAGHAGSMARRFLLADGAEWRISSTMKSLAVQPIRGSRDDWPVRYKRLGAAAWTNWGISINPVKAARCAAHTRVGVVVFPCPLETPLLQVAMRHKPHSQQLPGRPRTIQHWFGRTVSSQNDDDRREADMGFYH
ncbi:hypothetical protein F4780DRAFT_299772 [Xylariomycetidae sp. FL0641]|nr:hypothetical protein F4780DRAFT_299772 [Xylariomycetidae sp. FL0641]